MGEGFDNDKSGLGARLVGALEARQERFERAETLAGLKKEIEALERENKSLNRRLQRAYAEIKAAKNRTVSLEGTLRLKPSEEKKRIDHLEQAIEHALEQFRGNVRAKGYLDTPWALWTVSFLMRGLAPATDWRTPENQARLKRGDF